MVFDITLSEILDELFQSIVAEYYLSFTRTSITRVQPTKRFRF